MNVTHLHARKADVRVSLDGVTFVRSTSSAARRGVERLLLVPWDDIEGVTLVAGRKSRHVLRLRVAGASPVPDHRLDPHACTVDKSDAGTARKLMARIEDELATRRRWREHAARQPGPQGEPLPPTAGRPCGPGGASSRVPVGACRAADGTARQ